MSIAPLWNVSDSVEGISHESGGPILQGHEQKKNQKNIPFDFRASYEKFLFFNPSPTVPDCHQMDTATRA